MHAESLTVGFKRLEITCLIGTYPREAACAQKIYVSVSAAVAPVESDALSATTDYEAMAEVCRTTCQMRHRGLLETLAQELVQALVGKFALQSLAVTIEKPSALPDAECAFVEIRKEISRCAGR